jgi:hypothetical protein
VVTLAPLLVSTAVELVTFGRIIDGLIRKL